MKNLPPRTQPRADTVQHENITPDIETGTETGTEIRSYRRTTVTVDRETLSVLMRRTSPQAAGHSMGDNPVPDPPDHGPPDAPNNLTGGKP